MEVLHPIFEKARSEPRRIVFPESEDERILLAAARLAKEGVCRPVLLGPGTDVERAARHAGVSLERIVLQDPSDSALRQVCVKAAVDANRDSGHSTEAVEAWLEDRVHLAAAMVRAGLADGSVAGAGHSTAHTLRAALRILRPAPGIRTVSSFFLMVLSRPTAAGEHVLFFADCGLNPDPEPDQLAEIARSTASSYRTLMGREPRVALLSFSTHGSASHPRVERVVEAGAILRAGGADFPLDGELQLDAALVPEVARKKGADGLVAGRANVLIFPDLDSGNIGYKLTERLAGATAVGPILQGLSSPANDLSRGCSADDVVQVAAVTAAQCGGVE